MLVPVVRRTTYPIGYVIRPDNFFLGGGGGGTSYPTTPVINSSIGTTGIAEHYYLIQRSDL